MIGTLSIESNSSTRPRWTSTMGMAHCRKGRPRRASSFLHRLFFFPSNVEKGNPFLKVLQQQQQERITGSEPTISTIPTEDATTLKTITQSSNSSPDDTYNNKSLLFQFGHAQPHHVPAAMEFLQSQKDNITLLLQAIQSLSNLLLEETEPAIGRHSSEKATIVPTERFQRQLNQVLVRLDAVEQPWFALRQLTSLMWLLTSFNTETMEDENSDWQRMAAIVSSAKTFALEPTTERQEQQRAVYHVILDLTRKLKPFLSLPYPLGSESTVHSARLGLWTLQQWLRQSDHANSRVGASTMIVAESVEREDRGSGETDQSSSLVKTTPNELIDALRKVEQEVNQISSRRQAATNASPQSLAAIYNYIGLSHEIALRSGHDSVAHQVLAESMPSLSSMALSPSTASTFLEEIKLLHSQVTEHLVPYISKTVGVSPSPDDAMLHANYLSATGGPSTAMPRKSEAEQQRRDDYLSMLKLERHVTLDGALLCIFRLLQDILGVTIEPAHVEESAIWNKDVRLYHAFDDLNAQSFLGSFYLDPFHRNGKFARSATLPIFPKGYHELAQAVCVSLELPVPAWDSDPVMVSWNDCEALFHELGHVAQFLLVKPSGCLFGPQNMPLAFSEFLPKVSVL